MSAWEALSQWRDATVEWPVKLRKLEATGCFSPANKPMAWVPTQRAALWHSQTEIRSRPPGLAYLCRSFKDKPNITLLSTSNERFPPKSTSRMTRRRAGGWSRAHREPQIRQDHPLQRLRGHPPQSERTDHALPLCLARRPCGILESTIEITVIAHGTFGTPTVSVATFLTRRYTLQTITSGFRPGPVKNLASCSGMRTTTSIPSPDSGGLPA